MEFSNGYFGRLENHLLLYGEQHVECSAKYKFYLSLLPVALSLWTDRFMRSSIASLEETVDTLNR